MKNNIIIIFLTTFIAAQGINSNINSNINSYKTNVVLRPFEDKIEVITYVEIFNRNLQFLKKDIYFESSYDLNITLISEDGSKIEDRSFPESIEVDNFSKTVSFINPKLIIAKFIIWP